MNLVSDIPSDDVVPGLRPDRTAVGSRDDLVAILDGTTDLILVTDGDDVVTYASARSDDLLGVSPDVVVSRPLGEFVASADLDRVAEVARSARARRPGRRTSLTYAARLPTGETRLLEADVTAGPGAGDLIWAVRDLSPHAAHDLASDVTMHDQLTGLASRAMLVASLTLALARAERAHTHLATVVVGVDHFQRTWEEVGHRAAEELLLSAAGRLEVMLRPGDLLARTGVDEFALLLDGYRDADDVLATTRKALDSLARPVHTASRSLEMGASAGIALGGDGIGRSEELIEQASTASDHARHERPGAGLLFQKSMGAGGRPARDLTVDLREAIRDGQVRVVFQPIVRLDTTQLVGFEALARWDHPERGPVSPASFITVAEQSGLIVELGRHVLTTACRQMQTWEDLFPGRALRVGVNVSPRQLVDDRLVEDVGKALDRTGLPGEQLVVEVTESGVHHDITNACQVLGQLRARNVKIAMDDFGTGYSSLSYLRQLPLDIVKIDKCFLDDRAGFGPQLLSGMIRICHQLGFTPIAEGIEDSGQLQALREADCDLGQGFWFSRPLEAGAATQLLGRPDPAWSRA